MWIKNWCFAVLLVATGAAHAETFRVSAYLPQRSNSISQVMVPWLDSIERKSSGEIKFDRYWGGSLGRGPQRQIMLLQNGVTEIAFIWPGMTPGRFPDLQLLETPGLIQSATEGSVVAWRLYDEGLLRGFDNIKVLGFFTVSPARLFTTDSIETPANLKPLKIRTVGPVQNRYIKSLYGLPETLDAAQVSDGLRRGTIDGLIQGWTGLHTFRQFREVNYFLDLPAGVLTFAIAMNRERWESLNPQIRAVFLEHSGLTLSYEAGRTFDQRAVEIKNELTAAGELSAIAITQRDERILQEVSSEIVDDWVNDDQHRQEILNRTHGILNEMRYVQCNPDC